MFDFIVPPLVVGIIALALYKFFELLICRRERRMIIEKMEPAQMVDYLKYQPPGLRIGAPVHIVPVEDPGIASGSLKIGCLLLGLGAGLLFGFLLTITSDMSQSYETRSVVYSGSVLLFGGLGLVVAFIVERILIRKNKARQ